MPYRAVYLGLGVLGVVVVLLLILFRADLRRHCAAGPRWKRRLVSAGLMLLGATGFGADLGCTKKDQPGPTPTKITTEQPQPKGDEVKEPETTPQPKAEAGWLARIEEAARAAREVAAGKKGQYPFDRDGKRKMLASLDAAARTIDEQVAAGTLNAGEAGLWRADLKLLRSRVNAFRAAEMKSASCYEPMPMIIPASQSMARLKRRLPLLEKMAAADKLHPKVARKVLEQIEKDLAVLTSDAELKKLRTDKDRKLARKQAAATAQVLDRVRGRLGITAKGQDPRWAKVAQAWASLQAAIKTSTAAERKAAVARLEEAMKAVDALAREGKVSAAGADYTIDPAGNLRPCNHSALVLGNVRERGFWELARSPRMAAFCSARPAFCEDCALVDTCLGGCKAAAEVCGGDVWRCDPFLGAFRGEAKKRYGDSRNRR